MGPASPIVLLEDTQDDAAFVRRALQKANVSNPLVWLQTADQARKQLDEAVRPAVPALFIVDVNLAGGESGIDFLRWLRGKPAPLGSTPAMMLTGSERPEDRKDAELLGAIHFLQKPVTPDTLVDAVQSLGFVITSLTGFSTQRIIERRA